MQLKGRYRSRQLLQWESRSGYGALPLRSQVFVATPQTIADASRSSDNSTLIKWALSKTSGERPAGGSLPSCVFAWSVIDAYAAAACTPVSADRRVIPRCQFCQFATLSERCDAHKSKIDVEGRPFPRTAGFPLIAREAKQQWNGSSLPRFGFCWLSQWVLSWRSG